MVFLALYMVWILVFTELAEGNSAGSEHSLEKKKRSAPRGYYGGVGYPYAPFAEPLTILAGLAFLAYIVQLFHAVYHTHNRGTGLLNNVLPSKTNKMFPKLNERDVEKVLQ